MRGARLSAVVLAALAVVFLLAPASVAKSPPKGKYGCTLSGVGFFGTVKIVDGNTYKRNGKTGSYKAGDQKITFHDGWQGWKLKFKTGSFKGFQGRWYKSDTGEAEIALENPEDKGFESIYCVEE